MNIFNQTVIVINAPCRMCKQTTDITVPVAGYNAWMNGELIQRALPELTMNEREMLISQTCNTCWTKLFGDEDE